MLYAILCYHSEDVVCAWSKDEDDAVMAKLAVVHEKLHQQGKLGPVARLMPTTAATTIEPATRRTWPTRWRRSRWAGWRSRRTSPTRSPTCSVTPPP